MEAVKIQNVEKNFDYVLEKVGLTSFIKWDKFALSSSEIIQALDGFNKKMSIFRQCHHRNFFQTMKKLKSLDLPDLITAVKNKRLPKQALRGVLPLFKIGENQKIELIESVENLKQQANKECEDYISKNNVFVEELKKYQMFIDERIKQSGYVPEKPEQPVLEVPKATLKFNICENLASKIASNIKLELLPGTNYIGLKTFSQIIEQSYSLLKGQNQRQVRNARAEFRMNMKNEQKYRQVMQKHITNTELLIIEGQRLLASKLGVKKDQFDISQSLLIERGLGEHMNMLQSKLRKSLKSSITSNHDVSYEVGKQVIAYQIQLFTEKQKFIVKVLKGVSDNQQKFHLIPIMLSFILNDFTFEKYGYQQQDFMKYINDQLISNHPDLAKIFKDLQIAIIQMMQKIGVVNKEIGKILEEGAKQKTGHYRPHPLEIIQKQNQLRAQKDRK